MAFDCMQPVNTLRSKLTTLFPAKNVIVPQAGDALNDWFESDNIVIEFSDINISNEGDDMHIETVVSTQIDVTINDSDRAALTQMLNDVVNNLTDMDVTDINIGTATSESSDEFQTYIISFNYSTLEDI